MGETGGEGSRQWGIRNEKGKEKRDSEESNFIQSIKSYFEI
jgi:hypothetical protein